MSRFEAEAREVLLRRRRALANASPPSVGDPAGQHWIDPEAASEPLSEGVRRELAEIDAALARIQEGRFGTCVACGGPMGLQRLRALPEARYCLACSGHGPAMD